MAKGKGDITEDAFLREYLGEPDLDFDKVATSQADDAFLADYVGDESVMEPMPGPTVEPGIAGSIRNLVAELQPDEPADSFAGAMFRDAPAEFLDRLVNKGPVETFLTGPEEAMDSIVNFAGNQVVRDEDFEKSSFEREDEQLRTDLNDIFGIDKIKEAIDLDPDTPYTALAARAATETFFEALPATTPLRAVLDIFGGRLVLGSARFAAPYARALVRKGVRPGANIAGKVVDVAETGVQKIRQLAQRGESKLAEAIGIKGATKPGGKIGKTEFGKSIKQSIKKGARKAEKFLETNDANLMGAPSMGDDLAMPIRPESLVENIQTVPPKVSRAKPSKAQGAFKHPSGERVLTKDLNDMELAAKDAVRMESPTPLEASLNDLEAKQVLANQLSKDKEGFFQNIRGIWSRLITGPDKYIENTGPAGQVVAAKLKESLARGEIRDGSARAFVDEVITPLTDAERRNLVMVLDQGARPSNGRVGIAAHGIRTLMKEVAKDAKAVGLKIKAGDALIPWAPRPNFFPHVMDIAKVEAAVAAGQQDDLIKAIAKERGWGGSETGLNKARNTLNNHIKRMKAQTFGHLEKTRLLGNKTLTLKKGQSLDDAFFVTDPMIALKKYFSGAFERIEIARAFNPDGKKFDSLIQSMSNQQDRQYVQGMKDSMVGALAENDIEATLKQDASKAMDVVATALMGLSSVSNSVQGVFGSAIRTSLLSTIKGFYDTVAKSKDSRRFAMSAGTLVEDVSSKMLGVMGRMSRTNLQRTGFNFLEEANRVTSSAAARHYSVELLDAMKKGITEFHRREFTKFFGKRIKPEAVVKRGYFTDSEIKQVAHEITNITQGRARPIDLPFFTNSSTGKAAFFLRNFPFNWSKLIFREVVQEGLKGNPMPLIRLASAGAVVGQVPLQIRNLITGRDRPESVKDLFKPTPKNRPDKVTGTPWQFADKMLANAMAGIAYAGSLGIMGEMFGSVISNSHTNFNRIIGQPALAGPVSDAFVAQAKARSGKTPAAVPMIEFLGRRVAPIVAGKLPPLLTFPAIIASRAAAERAEGLTRGTGRVMRGIDRKLGEPNGQ